VAAVLLYTVPFDVVVARVQYEIPS